MTVGLPASLLVDFSKFRVCIHTRVLSALGNPDYILLMVNPNEKSIAIMRGSEKFADTHRVSYNKLKDGRCCEIYSRSFVKKLLEVCPEWRVKSTYRLSGDVIQGKSIAVFSMTGAEELRVSKEADIDGQ